MRIEVLRRLVWRRKVELAHAWRDAQRAEYQQAIDRITALEPAGMGTLGRPRS
jgi:hypothetical protein